MAGSGLTRNREALTPLGSQSSDEAFINEQLQNEIESVYDSKKTAVSEKSTKRKSRDRDDRGASDTDGSPRKKRSEKSKKKRERKRLSKLQHGRMDSPGSSAGVEPRSKELESNTPRTASKPAKVPAPNSDDLENKSAVYREQNESGKNEHYSSNLSGTGRRTSLGTNRDALLQSILRGCGPEKATISKIDYAASSRSETGDGPIAPITTGTPEVSFKEKNRRRVSMVPILPEGYQTGRSGRFHCPVEGCDKIYSRRSTLGEHMNTLHAGETLKDNLDGSMTIISPAEYQQAIANGQNEMIVEIPSVPLPRKTRKAHDLKEDDNKAIKVQPSSISLQQRFRDGNTAKEMEGSGARTSNARGVLQNAKKTQIVARTTPSKLTHPDRNSSEYETSSGSLSSDTDENPRREQAGRRLSTIQKPQPITSKDSPYRVSKIVKPIAPVESAHSVLSNFKSAHREGSMDMMGDWEIKPGVIVGNATKRSQDREVEHNIAYSSKYLNDTDAGVKLPGFHFQVVRVAPGSGGPGNNVPHLRVCSVSAGKVLVEVGEKRFSIGANGMWRIQAGEHCNIFNPYYGEAVLHVTSIK